MSTHEHHDTPRSADHTAREPMWRRYLRFHRPDPAADLDDELRDHLASTEEVLVAGGMSPDAARAETLRRFGNLAGVRAEVQQLDSRQSRRTRFAEAAETLLQDARFAARMLVRSPGFTVVAALSIALGVAANSTVFSVVNAVLLRPIPGANADRLVRVYMNHHSPFEWSTLSWFRDRAKSFEGIVGERYGAMSFQGRSGDPNERVRTSLVTSGFFTTLGVRMALGRAFDGDERTAAAAQPLAVLSHAFWQRRFGGDSGIIGRTVTVSGHPVVIVGVAPPDFRSSVMTWTPEIMMPFAAAPTLTGTRLADFGGSLYTTARLRPGISEAGAAVELDVLMAALAHTDSVRYERTTVRLDHTRGVNAELRTASAAGSLFLMGMVGLVLLIACANVANLLLGRAASRQTEIGVRLALGASRARIVRQLLTESLLLAIAGTMLGLAATYALTRTIASAVPLEAGLDGRFFAPDHRVLLFTGTMCVVTTLLFGLVPALRAASPRVVPMLKADVAHAARRRRGGLVAAQASLCVLLLAVASLFWRSLQSIRGLDVGFRATDVVDVSMDLSLAGGSEASQQAMFARILERVRGMPGVTAATLAAIVPLAGSNMETRVAPDGMVASSRFDHPSTYFNIVSPGYFATLRIPLRDGRPFLDTDRSSARRVAVVNETAAAQWWPNQDAVGKRFRWGGAEGPQIEVIGVARDADYNMPGESPRAFLYLPLAQEPRSEMVLQIRSTTGLTATRDAMWKLLREEAPSLPPPPVVRMSDDMAVTLLPVRTGASLLGGLGMVALLLAAAGIYGVTGYAVASRTREIGIRAALGAGRARLLRMIVGESLRPVTTGLVVGLGMALLAAVGLSRVLHGVRPLDPLVLPGVAIALMLVALAASLVPAWRAASVDPVIAIRSE